MFTFTESVALFLVLLTLESTANPGPPRCFIDLVDNPDNVSPLIVDTDYNFPNPTNLTGVSIHSGQRLYWACPGGYFSEPGFNVNGQIAHCGGGTFHTGQGHPILYENVTCTLIDALRPHLTEIHINPGVLCELGTSRPISIGYSVNHNFVKVLDACFQTDVNIPLYTKYTLTRWASLIPNHREPPSRYFYAVDIIHADVANVYNDINGNLENLGLENYINDTFFLTKGSLSSQWEFLYTYQRDATFDLTNVAPQWNSVGSGNWGAIISGVQTFLELGGIGDEAKVISGTLKVATLTDSSGSDVELYLLNGKVPVPRWFWKLIYFPELHFGAIFFVYNNIYHEKSQVDAEFLAEICVNDVLLDVIAGWSLDDIKYDDQTGGFAYACVLNTAQILDPVILKVVANFLAEVGVQAVNLF
ncbi:hypothetical protein Zmor_015662 [Zophobas morio]|uniref:DNA/RNA non-specific endonuclease/pyrophosphatase/phosphodiesterase domain-containing protein n=1 Tax=Zophobas morio TaxID=2755281 RepID=A0AA38IND1_9CUCU|nr:hypothetical protein Zmor_015662 [Zophobas morio]